MWCYICEHGVINNNQGKSKAFVERLCVYQAYRTQNGMIGWRCTCCASTHCPASVYTDLLCTSKSSVENQPQPTKMSVTKMFYYQNVCYTDVLLPRCPITEMSSYQDVLLPKCLLPKRLLPKCPLPKCLDTILTVRWRRRNESGFLYMFNRLFLVALKYTFQ